MLLLPSSLATLLGLHLLEFVARRRLVRRQLIGHHTKWVHWHHHLAILIGPLTWLKYSPEYFR